MAVRDWGDGTVPSGYDELAIPGRAPLPASYVSPPAATGSPPQGSGWTPINTIDPQMPVMPVMPPAATPSPSAPGPVGTPNTYQVSYRHGVPVRSPYGSAYGGAGMGPKPFAAFGQGMSSEQLQRLRDLLAGGQQGGVNWQAFSDVLSSWRQRTPGSYWNPNGGLSGRGTFGGGGGGGAGGGTATAPGAPTASGGWLTWLSSLFGGG